MRYQGAPLKKNLYVQEVQSESVDAYRQGRIALEKRGYTYQGYRSWMAGLA